MVVGDLVAGRYELEELVGTGGMSSVYRAHDRLLDRKVALKVLHPQFSGDGEYVERFRREARSAARLSHENVVTVIDRGEADGRPFIVFEYVDGENLKALVGRHGPLPLATALSIAVQIARGLAFAHEQGLVHRDVKPQNVLMNDDGRARVTDFGIARSLDVKHGMTQTGTVLGTSDYIAPEQAQGQRVGPQTDVYSLGAVLYELLTGEVPFPGESFVTVAMRHINEPAPSVRERRPEVPPRLDEALRRAMAKDAADRFPSMEAFCAELELCRREVGGDRPRELDPDATLVVPAQRSAGRPRRRRGAAAPWLVLLVAGLLAAGVVAAGFAVWRSTGSGSGSGATASAAEVQLQGIGAYDPPPGDGHEHDAEASLATDGKLSTAWSTEHYHDAPSLDKPGVGLVLDAGKAVELSRLRVATDTPGFTAEIRAGDSPDGPFRAVSDPRTVAGDTVFELRGTSARYFVVWITRLGGGYDHADVNEVGAG